MDIFFLLLMLLSTSASKTATFDWAHDKPVYVHDAKHGKSGGNNQRDFLVHKADQHGQQAYTIDLFQPITQQSFCVPSKNGLTQSLYKIDASSLFFPADKLVIPWKQKSEKLSAQPALMGKQMGVVQTPGVAPLGYELDGEVKVFRLVAQPIKQVLVDESQSTFAHLIPEKNKLPHAMHHMPKHQKIKCWGYNGSTPGPTIEATEGDRVRIIIKNELPEPTSIHWHGIELPNDQDGAAPEAQHPIMPGCEHTYEFTLYQSGTVMYHSGFNVMRQDLMGLAGTFVIHPKKYEKCIDKDFAIMLQQWALMPGNEYVNVMTMDFNWFTFNGKAAPNIPVLTVNQGDRVRIRFGNIVMDSHPIHLHGYIWDNVGTEGGPIPPLAQTKGSTILVSAGTTRDVEFTAWNPGLWRLHCHKLHHVVNAHAQVPMGQMAHGGMFTLLHVIPKNKDAAWVHPSQEKELS